MTPAFRALVGALMVVSVLAGSLVLTAGPATACTCAELSADLADGSDLVFTGEVEDSRSDGAVQTVRVDEVFKGDVTRRVDVVNDIDGTCVFEWPLGAQVLVFGNLERDEVRSSLCTSAVSTDEGYRQVVQALGEGMEPSPGYTEADSVGLTYDQWRTGRLVFGVIGLTLMGFVAFRAFRAWWSRRRTTDDR
ncbi:hypothetical protein ASG88_10390 [Nocardioides sp. Soil777]|uniref:hypothetical protein n=1 Tax=Nocardioides sp. Soil777 TaxID=1736409 RepID=UPI000702E040|nr:hypothetical protein [Nocardioides sp. Soil777]KRF00828.1 hypothetical protein ASG88_10390 [Nocardioides sp. Soil777]